MLEGQTLDANMLLLYFELSLFDRRGVALKNINQYQ